MNGASLFIPELDGMTFATQEAFVMHYEALAEREAENGWLRAAEYHPEIREESYLRYDLS